MTTARDVIDAIYNLRVNGKCTDENGIAACLEAYVDARIARVRTERAYGASGSDDDAPTDCRPTCPVCHPKVPE